MKYWNEGKPYREQVRPFGFLVAPMARKGVFADMSEPVLVDPHKRGAPPAGNTAGKLHKINKQDGPNSPLV
jgi:hypothetical protein